MFERQRAAVADSAMHLNRSIRCLAAKTVRAKIADRNHVADLKWILSVHLPGGPEDVVAHHLVLGPKLDQRELDRLLLGEQLAESDTRPGVLHRFLDTVAGGAGASGGLTD